MDQDRIAMLIDSTTLAVELAGVAVIVIGGLASGLLFVAALRRDSAENALRKLRSDLGRAILLGLELLIAADIINTVAIEPTLTNVAVLAGIVAVRTFLSLSLEVEIEGRWPWQRGRRPEA